MSPLVSLPPALAVPKNIGTAFALTLLAAPLVACNDHAATTLERAGLVHTEIIQPRDSQASLTLTGEVQARYRADLSFRVSGRVLTRLVDVGAHVKPLGNTGINIRSEIEALVFVIVVDHDAVLAIITS